MKAKSLPRENVVPVAKGYDRWAEVYESDGNPLLALEQPEVERLLGEVRGSELLDLGCGTGRHAIWLAAAGAKVTALDLSAGMLAKAQAKPGAGAVRFVRHDLEERLPFDDASFDRVLTSLVLEHVVGIDSFFAEMRRVCRPGGMVLATAMHPAMMLLGRQASFTDPASGEKIYPASHAHQLGDFVMAALRAGLTLDHLGEHAIDEVLARRLPRAEKYLGWSMLFVMRGRRGG